MTATFPPLPWTEGDTFKNDTTNVTYVFNGKAWVSAGSPGDPQVDYLPLSGGDLSGLLNINVGSGVALSVNTNKVKFWSSGAVELNGYTAFKDNELVTKSYVDTAIRNDVDLSGYMPLTGGKFTGYVQFEDDTKLQMGGTYNNNIIDGAPNFTDNSIVATLGYVKHQINALGDSVGGEQVPSTCRKFKYAGDRSWASMRPGEFQLLDKDTNITNELDKCAAIIFKGEDADGNRAVRDENRISYQSFGGSALNILNSGLTRLYFRAPVGLLEYGDDIDCYSLWWSDRDAGARRTSTFTKFTNSQTIYLQCADMFF